jgi:hypothetical protein
MDEYKGANAPRKMCLVCGNVLDYHEASDTYDHTIATIDEMGGAVDHPVIPVFPSEAPQQLVEKCDFCYADGTSWVVPARSFTLPYTNSASTGDWAACALCGPLVVHNRWNELFRRVKAGWQARMGEEMPPPVETSLKAMYRKLRKNITGAPYEGQPKR